MNQAAASTRIRQLLNRIKHRIRWNELSNGHLVLWVTTIVSVLAYGVFFVRLLAAPLFPAGAGLLTDPFLQLPTADSVRVVWFTEFPGSEHFVQYGSNLNQTAIANTTQLSRMREDSQSRVGEQTEDGQIYSQPTDRPIWRHEAEVKGLPPGQRISYRVGSVRDSGRIEYSDRYTLSASPPAGQPLKILLTSDHQLMPMTPANLQKVVETVGQVDAVLLAGDLVNIPDRASEWFDDNRGGAFFPSLQGRANRSLTGSETSFRGGKIIQSAPLFPALGNHEVMGRFSMELPLNEQYNDPVPIENAVALYSKIAPQINPANDPAVQQTWIKNHSFNSDSYEEIFTLPNISPGGEKYYAVTLGDVRLISLEAGNIWRVPSLEPTARGRYRERDGDLPDTNKWGYGQHIFEPIAAGSPQYIWLQEELNRPEFQQAKYKIVMFHHPPHSLGDNIVPPYTNPVQIIDRLPDGQIKSVRYEYPIDRDYLLRDVVPLLEQAGVQLVLYGHSHLWNRFDSPGGMHFLETSNVGNTYGAFLGEKRRPIPIGFQSNYVPVGDPGGLAAIVPSISALLDESGQPQPFIASNEITVFSILDTGTGTVSSYRFDTRQPNGEVVRFDEFQIVR
ncbi:fibronectin type III domain-containing protein [Leptolyngbya ohadii]|uniref:fibronectin type III domain-containing protein n=1 Tax=Leptolyngbya ohadii TaxID=1962290 RepID=UPI000B59EC03|nr:fibronectin type III domain-containing protein [Leptolyngbya ohadii]